MLQTYHQKDERSPEFKQKPEDVHGIIDGKKESLGITSLTGCASQMYLAFLFDFKFSCSLLWLTSANLN